MEKGKHKYIFYIYPIEKEKYGRFVYVRRVKDYKKQLIKLGLKFDYKMLY